jgi:translocator protein
MAEPMRREWWRYALVTVPAIVLLGSFSGWISNSGYGNEWFDALDKPFFMPPGWVFGVVWPVLYAMLGIAVA